MNPSLTRRATLYWFGAAMASVLPARLALSAPAIGTGADDSRLVVVMLRGALDGLAAVPATGDPAWAGLRAIGDAQPAPALPLHGIFGLHPALAQMHGWYGQGELLVIHATATPYRERSHFDAQQLLESGGAQPFALSTGWLGRALAQSGQSGMALAAAMPLALRGADNASTWTPSRAGGNQDDLMARVANLYRDDPQLSRAFSKTMGQPAMAMDNSGDAGFASLARQAGLLLSRPAGPRVAWLEAGGWDTHTQQTARLGRLLAGLDEAMAALRAALGEHWSRTTVLVMTEFGRSATLNGSGGTDHGTAGAAFLAGGAVAGGRVLADWPGLGRTQLVDGRDLRPTLDLRSVIAAVVQRQFGLSQAQLAASALPGAPQAQLDLWRT